MDESHVEIFLKAILDGDCEAADRLLTDDPQLLAVHDEAGNPPLLLADSVEMARLLLSRGASIHDSRQGDCYTALHFAVYRGNDALAEFLLSAGASPDADSETCGGTPLHIAAGEGNLPLIELLVAYGADLNRKSDGFTPLSVATIEGHNEAAERLVQLGADVNVPNDPHRLTPLHQAAISGNVRLVRFLLTRGANPNLRDRSGCTPLECAGTDEVCAILEAARPS